MENLKFILISIIILIIVGVVGYWAISTIEPGSVYVEKQKQQELEQENEKLQEEIKKLTDELEDLKSGQEQLIIDNVNKEVEQQSTENINTKLKYQSLINDLQKLIDDNIYMKEKSRGTRVGTVQTFLNIYNNTSKKIDNDYGAGTKADVLKFQEAEGLTADGEAGPSTFQKMIAWLEKQG